MDDLEKNLNNHPLAKQIAEWERTSIEKIQKKAEEQRQRVRKSMHRHTQMIKAELSSLTEEMQKIAKTDDFNETILNQLRAQLKDFEKQFNDPLHIVIKEDSSRINIKKLLTNITATRGKYISQILIIKITSAAFYCL